MTDKTTNWKRLDNAGKLFSSIARKGDAKVFRFSCELNEDVICFLLQKALEDTLLQFPIYNYTLKKGLFWCYLEKSTFAPKVVPETKQPCSPMYDSETQPFLFEVSYYKKRINLEVFHVLSDGTGAMRFLRTLVCYYLKRLYPAELISLDPLFDYNASEAQQLDDSFAKHYTGKRAIKATSSPKAYQVRGLRTRENQINIIEGVIPTDSLLAAARHHGCTISALLIGVLIDAIHSEAPKRQNGNPIVIALPVNLRGYFKSSSLRNFFSVIYIKYDYSSMPENFDEMLHIVSKSLKEQLTTEQLSQRIDTLSALEHNTFLKFMPLVTKNLALLIANSVSSRGVTSSISNLGAVHMPEETQKYIRLFDLFFPASKPQLGVCSFGNNTNISFSSPFYSSDIQMSFFRTLQKMNMDIEIVSNNLEPRRKVKSAKESR